MGQREADRRHRPKEDRSWCQSGRFPVDKPQDCHTVRCGICLEDFQHEYSKARHLTMAHGARVERHCSPAGVVEYHWRIP